jgi:hypothetical protein
MSDPTTTNPERPRTKVVSPEEAQQAREAEAWSYTANVIYKGAEILYSYELPSGDIVVRRWLLRPRPLRRNLER